jgi:hypothetical protein
VKASAILGIAAEIFSPTAAEEMSDRVVQMRRELFPEASSPNSSAK